MNVIQTWIVLTVTILSILIFIKSTYESIKKKNSFGETLLLFWMGVFVWGDALTIAPFWFIFSFISFLLKDWLLFLLIISIFWTIRSLGETFYWLNQQFSTINRNPPERLKGYWFLKNDSIWFVYQNFWQCLTVISIIVSIYLINLLFKNNF